MQTELRRIREQEYPIMEAFLGKCGLKRDAMLEYSAGIFHDSRLIATGSISGSSLRCLAVDPSLQGQGLMAKLIEHLVHVQLSRKRYHIFLYTKPEYSALFTDLGFTEIVRDEERMVFMENRKFGFRDYIRRLQTESHGDAGRGRTGAVVMNANPFTLGHAYLISQALEACDLLHVFVLSEDASVFPAADRLKLVQKAVSGDPRVLVHPTDSYLISGATFPAYFLHDSEDVSRVQAAVDAQIFAEIAGELGISCRFMGEEPCSRVTALYNEVTAEELHKHQIEVCIIPRHVNCGEIVSASTVRKALRVEDWEQVRAMVPDVTWEYLHSEAGEKVVNCLQSG